MSITIETLKQFNRILSRYKTAKAATDARLTEAERWWRLRNTSQEAQEYATARDDGHHSASGWLHNVIVNKHADAMEAYPEPHILPREESDTAEAEMLTRILPCVLEQNRFEATWSDLAWQKLKTGTSVCKVVWDSRKLQGLGDIAIERVNLRDIYWDPQVSDIQHSRYLFHIEWVDRESLREQCPDLHTHDLRSPLTAFGAQGQTEDGDRVPVIEVYYKKTDAGRETLQYCRYAGDCILFATENDPELSARGLYDHARYPYVFDPLFPIEGSPCGYGFVDLCRGAQTELDLLKSAFVRNALVGATPRYFSRGEGLNEEEFLDLTRPVVHVNSASEDTLRRIEHNTLAATYIDLYDRTVKELRETSGNTETGSGNIGAGVTAASAIAALQDASGKGSRDANAASYRAYSQLIELCIELIRQFYTLPRRFRIAGKSGSVEFVRYTADGIRPIPRTASNSSSNPASDLSPDPSDLTLTPDTALRLPTFDVTVTARRRSAYSAAAENELILELFRLGFFDPNRRDEARTAAELLDFEGKKSLLARLKEK